MQCKEESIESHLAMFIGLFIVSIPLACVITAFSIGPNIAGIGHVLVALFCGAPLAIGLFLFANMRMKKWPVLRTLLPLAVFPLLLSLTIGYTLLYERNPRHMFQVFVADPIPAGVTDIQAMDISAGFSEDVVIIFRAPPEVVDSIIAQQQLEKMENESFSELDFPGEYFPENSYTWGPNWVWYQRIVTRDGTERGPLQYYIKMWVDPTQSIVIYETAS